MLSEVVSSIVQNRARERPGNGDGRPESHVQYSGSEVSERDRFRDPLTSGDTPWEPNYEGDMEREAIQAVPVTDQAVLSEFLTVIGCDDYQGAVEQPAPLQLAEEMSDF